MICRIATFEKKPDVSEEKVAAFRAWLTQQPGLEALYHLHDPSSGKALSISFWESAEHLLALKDRTPPGGPIGLKPDKVETFTEVVEG